ncbi:MAG: taurine catabolism dioxygenase TauD [Rhodospirillaceae bacterium]|nr:taurine catabolism dioxygenase TauD [Rhodospirillaceae bacterium]|tara:strand:+ start:13171 stop:14007 length:837 start_codon:yes stop_codon:yes gene_type:complete
MTIDILPLSGAIGAEIRGVDLSQPVAAELQRDLLNAWHKYVLILFRNQNLTDDALLNSSSWIGPLGARSRPAERRQEKDPYIMLVSNIRKNGEPIGSLPDGEMWFHHDMAFVDVPHKATFLYSVEVPDHGGNTKFANMYAAYDLLPERLKKALAGKRVMQIFDYKETSQPRLSDLDKVKHAWHPAIVRHPDTGRKALYVNRLMTVTIEGMPHDEARAIIEEVIPFAEDPSIIYEHKWRPGDFLVWDNRCSTHARTDFPETERRLLKRGMIEGAPLMPA